MKRRIIRADGRLAAVMSFVREGSVCADIGTDHAYIPIELVKSGRVPRALASDVVEGPLERARENIAEQGLSELITVRRADGLRGIDDYAPEDIIIAGMGGELIARIIDESEYVRRGEVRLILQPMTRHEALRGYLCDNGFAIDAERLVREDGRIYRIMCCRFGMLDTPYSKLERLCGRYPSTTDVELLTAHLNEVRSYLAAKTKGLMAAGEHCEDEEAMLCLLTNYITSLKS